MLSRYEYFGALALAALAAVLHTLVYFENYDFTKGLWQQDTALFLRLASYLPLVAMLLLSFVLAGSLKRRGDGVLAAAYAAESRLSRAFSYATAAVLLLTVVCQLAAIGSDSKLAALLDSYSRSYMALTATLHILTLLSAAFAAGYFFFAARKRAFRGERDTAIPLGIALICYFIFYTLRVYFDMTLHINNPRWSYGVATLVLTLLYFVTEVDQLLFRKKPIAYAITACLALVSSFSYGVSEVAMAIFGKTDDLFALIYPVLSLAVAVYIAARLYLALFFEPSTVGNASESEQDGTGVTDTTDATVVTGTAAEGGDTDELVGAPLDGGMTDGDGEITREELRRFYRTIYAIVAKKRGITEDSSQEDKDTLRREVLSMLSHLLEGDSRQENIEHMRAFLARYEG